jgi:AcrR family transcriptional regulator
MTIANRMSGNERRLAIIEAAVNLFAERGFQGVTTRELAASVGVTEPVLYQHFPSKRDLYYAIIEWKMDQSKDLQLRLKDLSENPNCSSRDFYRDLGRLVLDWHHRDPNFMRLVLRSGLEGHELQNLCYERLFAGYFDTLVNKTKRLAVAENWRAIDPATATYFFFAALHTHCLDSILFQHPLGAVEDETLVDTFVDIFLNGVKEKAL